MKRTLQLSLFLLLISALHPAKGQVAIGTGASAPTPNPNAVLLLVGNGTNQGLVIPSVTSLSGFGSAGMVVYNSATNTVHYHNGTAWNQVGAGGSGTQGIQISGNTVSLTATPNAGFGLSGPTPTSTGQLLVWNGTGWESTPAPTTTGQTLSWNQTTGKWTIGAGATVATLSGDVSGASNSTAISNTAGNNIATALNNAATTNKILESRITPSGTNNQVLTTVAGVAQWANATGGVLPSLSANQLLSNNGSNTGITVAGDLGLSVAGTTGTFTITNNAVTTAKINNGAVTIAKIGTAGVPDANKILSTDASGVPQWTIAAGGGDMLKSTYDPTNINGSAFNLALHTGQITTAQITDANVTNIKLAAGIDAAKITTGTLPGTVLPAAGGELSGTLSTLTINNNAITTTKINNGAVTIAKIGTAGVPDANKILSTDASGVPQWTVAAGGGDMLKSTYDPTNINGSAFNLALHTGQITTAQITDANVTNIKLATGIDAAKITTGILSGTVLPANVLLNSSTAGGELSGTLAALSINNNAIITTKINNGAVTIAKIGTAGVPDANKILSTDASGVPQWTIAAGGGDMLKSTYDPTNINGSAFNLAIHTGQISTAQITDANVTNIKLATGIDAAKITTGTLSGTVLPAAGGELSGTLSTLTINNNAITTTKINNGAVTIAKIGTAGVPDANKVLSTDASGVPQWTVAAGGGDMLKSTYDPTNINGSAFNLALHTGQITTAQITDANVTNIKLATGIDAAKITTGILPVAQVPNLDAAKITTGTFTAAQIPSLDASKITTGTLPLTLGGTGGTSAGTARTSLGLGSLATLSAVDLSGVLVTNTLPVARGGTNSIATPTNGALAYGTGTAFAFTAAGTSGQILQSNGAAAPTWVNAPASLPSGTIGQTLRHNGTNFVATSNLLNDGTTLTIDGINNTNGDMLVIRNNTTSQYSNLALDGDAINGGYLSLRSGGVQKGFLFNLQNEVWLGSEAGAGPLKLYTNGAERMRIDATGNVGIGTTTPTYPLDIKTPNGASAYGLNHSDGTIIMSTYVGSGGVTGGSIGTQSNHPFFIYTANGGAKLTVLPNGNVGIGTTAPASKLEVRDDALTTYTSPFIRLTNNNASGQIPIEFQINGIERGKIRADNVGNMSYVTNGGDHSFYTGGDFAFGIERLKISNNGLVTLTNTDWNLNPLLLQSNGSSAGSSIRFTNPAVGNRTFDIIGSSGTGASMGAGSFGIWDNTSSAYRFVISPSGNVGIGATTPTQKLHVIGNILASGTITPSDSRLKENINDLNYGIREILRLRPVSYNWKTDPKGKKVLGLIAQETVKITPEVIELPQSEKDFYSMNYVQLIPVLIKAAQELNQKNESLEKENNLLKAELATLKQKQEVEMGSVKKQLEAINARLGLEAKKD